jgi:hypothetical protein
MLKIVHQLVLTELRFSVSVSEFETPNSTVADRAQEAHAAWQHASTLYSSRLPKVATTP